MHFYNANKFWRYITMKILISAVQNRINPTATAMDDPKTDCFDCTCQGCVWDG